MQRGVDLLRPDYVKKKTSENEAIVYGFGATVQQKGNGVRAHIDGFQKTPVRSTLQCASMRPIRFPC